MNAAQQAAAGTGPQVFFQLSKIDEEKRLVYGRAVQETPDRVGEIFDYASSKPLFEKWSGSQSESSFGKSAGNVRAMHKDIAAGIIVPGGMTFDDEAKAIDICVKVTDDQEWEKTRSGTYTGFSIGGKYAKKWEDTELKKTRYTAEPSEVSLVDRPCVPTARFFEIQKADGSLVKVDFQATQGDDLEKAGPPKDAKKGDKWKDEDGNEMEHDGEGWKACKAQSPEDLEKAEQDRIAAEHADKMAKARERFGKLGIGELRKGVETTGLTAEALDAMNPDNLLEAYYDAVVKMEANDDAEFDVPGTPEQVDEFLKLLRDHKLDFPAALGIVKGVVLAQPELLGGAYGVLVRKAADAGIVILASTGDNVVTREAYMAKGLDPKGLRKGLLECSAFAQLLQSVCNLAERVEYEAYAEQDGSALPQRLRDWMRDGGDMLADMVREEVLEEYEDDDKAEAAHGTDAQAVPPLLAMNDKAKGLKKRFESVVPLAKLAPPDLEALRKDASDAVELRKLVGEQDDMLKKLAKENEVLKSMPANAKGVRLIAVGKGDDITDADLKKVEPVKDGLGQAQDAATLIKGLHQTGGQPLHAPLAK